MQVLSSLFTARQLAKKRTFAKASGALPPDARRVAPPQLRGLRRIASDFEKTHRFLVKSGADISSVQWAKLQWSRASAKCCPMAKLCKLKSCSDWCLLAGSALFLAQMLMDNFLQIYEHTPGVEHLSTRRSIPSLGSPRGHD